MYEILVGLPRLAWEFYCQLCLFVLPLYLYVSPLYLSIFVFPQSISLSLPSIFIFRPSISILYLSLSLPSPSLFPDKKFPALGWIPSFRSKFGNYTFT
jgi:hypothetical protein